MSDVTTNKHVLDTLLKMGFGATHAWAVMPQALMAIQHDESKRPFLTDRSGTYWYVDNPGEQSKGLKA